MARPTSEKVGRGLCPACHEPVTYRKSTGGMLTHRCDNCDSSGYAEPGGSAYAANIATIKGEAKPAPEAAPEVAPVAPTKPKKTAFSLANL